MTPRDVLVKFITDGRGFPFNEADRFADGVIAALKDEGLFIGPVVATPEMGLSATAEQPTLVLPVHAAETWSTMVAEWQRGEGA